MQLRFKERAGVSLVFAVVLTGIFLLNGCGVPLTGGESTQPPVQTETNPLPTPSPVAPSSTPVTADPEPSPSPVAPSPTPVTTATEPSPSPMEPTPTPSTADPQPSPTAPIPTPEPKIWMVGGAVDRAAKGGHPYQYTPEDPEETIDDIAAKLLESVLSDLMDEDPDYSFRITGYRNISASELSEFSKDEDWSGGLLGDDDDWSHKLVEGVDKETARGWYYIPEAEASYDGIMSPLLREVDGYVSSKTDDLHLGIYLIIEIDGTYSMYLLQI